MTRRTAVHPELADSRAGSPLFSTWRVGTPERQRVAVDAIAGTWQSRPWPAEGLLGYYVYAGHDGTTLMHHSRWTGEQEYEDFVAAHRQQRVDEIDRAVPGIERIGLGRYRRYRSLERAAGDTRVPGLVVTVEIGFEAAAAGRRSAWVDLVLDALADDPAGNPGLISAHFHLNDDGTKVLNYAEWESAEAYDKALAAPGEGVGSVTEHWERVRNFPGLTRFSGSRYTYVLGLEP
ncbi:antibiotic biosynthesis monooxygenase [Streptomyces sp. NPDC058371]|uniref:antibiotic biosynthesis monooxygenase n=1 Tax=Streptomyces sp. NPDC058371 TaxID=3346463 RepID=UPI00366A4A58